MDKKRKIILVAIIVAIVVIVSIIVILIYHNKPQNNAEKQLLDITQKVQQDLEFSNIQINKAGASTIISGTVKNNKQVTVDAKLQMKLYYENGQLGGTSNIQMENLAAQEIKDFEISLVGDYTVCSKYEVLVESLIEK